MLSQSWAEVLLSGNPNDQQNAIDRVVIGAVIGPQILKGETGNISHPANGGPVVGLYLESRSLNLFQEKGLGVVICA